MPTLNLLKSIAFVFIASSGLSALATPWVGMPGQTDLTVAYESTQYDDMFTADGVETKGWGVTSQAVFFGLSHDLTDTVRFSVVTGYGQSSSTKPGGKTDGLLDTDVKVALNLIDPYETNGFGLGIRVGYRAPGTYTVAKVPHGLGKRVQAATTELLLGYSFSTLTFESALGYRLSSNPAPNDIFGHASVVWHPITNTSIELHHTFQFAQSGADLGPDVSDLVTLKEDDQTLHAIVSYQVVEDMNLGIRFAKTVAGRNAPDSTRFGFSINYRL